MGNGSNEWVDRVVIVTGGGSGIGRAAAQRFARAGARVAISGRRQATLDAVAADLAADGCDVLAVAADVATAQGADGLVSRTVAAFGGVDVLVNNAGVGYSHGIEHPGSMADLADTPADLWQEVMRINLDSMYFMCHRVIPELRRRGGGVIVNVASTGGLRAMADAHTYSAAKAGMINLTRSMAKTYGRENIRSNCLAPGFVDTPMVEPVLGDAANPFADEEGRFEICPLGRPGLPDEMADGIVFLAGNGYANGSVLVLDGGTTV